MAGEMMLAVLLHIALPGRDIRLCDGGIVWFQGQKYLSVDEEFGTVAALSTFEEEIGNEAPGGELTMLPPDTAAAATLSTASYQTAPMRFWIVEVDMDTALAIEPTAELVADMMLDTTSLRTGHGYRKLVLGMMSAADRLWNVNEGNELNGRFHKSVFPGELGMDNATGVPVDVDWGGGTPGGMSRGKKIFSFGLIGGLL